jgi:hypothetical protein
VLTDSVTGFSKYLISSQTSQQQNWATDAPVPKSYGFDLPINGMVPYTNYLTGSTYASWTFRKQPKFFDVVTYTGDGNSSRTVSHNLGSVPGCIIVKTVSGANDWVVSHRSLVDQIGYLNQTWEFGASAHLKNSLWTSTTFTPGNAAATNQNGVTYVAYLFAHDAGGFGLTGTDNVISCGSFTGTGSTVTVNLGYEPQWVLIKRTDDTGDWFINDTMRGWTANGTNAYLRPNTSGAESAGVTGAPALTATGFTWNPANGATFIYIAIRRGPMKTPTTGTSVYENVAYTGNATANRQIGTSVLMDLMLLNNRDATAQSWSTYGQMFFDRLRGDDVLLATASTSAESTGWQTYFDSDMNVGWDTSTTTSQDYLNKSGATFVSHIFRRAPGFFDVVCYTGDDGSNRALSHNLAAVPELAIFKRRSGVGDWLVWTTSQSGKGALLNTTDTFFTNANVAGSSTWTSSTIYIKNPGFDGTATNGSGSTYVAYLFASCPGVSKVFSFTGNGSSQTINCGFTGGSRLVLIKRTDSTGNWVIFDSARGIVAGNDPALYLNSTAAEVTGVDAIDTDSTGFIVNQETTFNLNVNNATYIGLAIS